MQRYTANVFLPGCLGPVKREVVLADDLDLDETKELALFEATISYEPLKARTSKGNYRYKSTEEQWRGWLACAKSRATV